ncbi:hypothetical protein FRC08_007062, partial [Ceratobasidium sp. 394]
MIPIMQQPVIQKAQWCNEFCASNNELPRGMRMPLLTLNGLSIGTAGAALCTTDSSNVPAPVDVHTVALKKIVTSN